MWKLERKLSEYLVLYTAIIKEIFRQTHFNFDILWLWLRFTTWNCISHLVVKSSFELSSFGFTIMVSHELLIQLYSCEKVQIVCGLFGERLSYGLGHWVSKYNLCPICCLRDSKIEVASSKQHKSQIYNSGITLASNEGQWNKRLMWFFITPIWKTWRVHTLKARTSNHGVQKSWKLGDILNLWNNKLLKLRIGTAPLCKVGEQSWEIP